MVHDVGLLVLALKADPDTSPSQLTREQIPEALTQGMRQEGMMAIADPTFADPSAQAYAVS